MKDWQVSKKTRRNGRRGLGWLAGAACLVGASPSCSTLEIPPQAPAPPLPPLLSVPHPAGSDLSDVRDLFFDKQAPTLDSLKTCDADFRKLQQSTQSRSELVEGATELVRRDPVHYHWCFYSRILSLESALKGELYVDERQKRVLETFEFLVPVARSFLSEFHDSRYLRYAIFRYQKLSEWVFFRRVEPSPKETEELVDTANPLGLARGGQDKTDVLDHYGITRAPAADAGASTEPPPAAPFKPFQAIDPAQSPAIEPDPATPAPSPAK